MRFLTTKNTGSDKYKLVIGSAIVLIFSTAALTSQANDYPTLERVDYVLTCMAAHGGQNIENLYSCSCKVDVVASQISLEEWDEAKTFSRYKRMPGEKGGIFREAEGADELVMKMEDAEKDGEKRCFVGKHFDKGKKDKAKAADK